MLNAAQRAFMAARPIWVEAVWVDAVWFDADWAIGVWFAVAGTALILLRSRFAALQPGNDRALRVALTAPGIGLLGALR